MEDWAIGSTSAADVDVQNKWTYLRSEALMITSKGGGWQRLTRDLDPDTDRLALVPIDYDHKSIYAPKDEVADLFELWEIPLAAVTWFFDRKDTSGLYTAKNSTSQCILYSVYARSMGINNFNNFLRVFIWQSLYLSTSRSRTLVFYPLAMKEPLVTALSNGSSVTSNVNSVTVHWILMRAAITTWIDQHTMTMTSGLVTIQKLAAAVRGALDTKTIMLADHMLMQFLSFTFLLRQNRARVTELGSYFDDQRSATLRDALLHSATWVRNTLKEADSILERYFSIQEMLRTHRHSLSTCIEARNADYVLRNTIALRRLAQQNLSVIKEQQRLSANSQKESRAMAKIAYSTMIYLPASFVATFFSMPFLSLNEQHKFNELGLLWIYILAATALTVLTFVLSWAWDKYLPKTESTDPFQPEPEDAENIVGYEDFEHMEPVPYIEPDDNDLLQQVIKAYAPKPSRPDLDDDDAGDVQAQSSAVQVGDAANLTGGHTTSRQRRHNAL